MFRNVRFYRFAGDWPETEEAVSEALNNVAFRPCGPLSERSSGWVTVDSNEDGSLARRINGADLIRLRSQSRVLPPAAINEELEVRIEEFRSRMGEPPNPREKRRLKAETREALLAQALCKSDRTWGYVDLGNKILGIDAGAPATSDRFLSYLREVFDGLNLTPLAYPSPVSGLLTQIFLGNAPPRFFVGRECRMQDAADPGSVVRWSDFDLTDSTISNHVADGMHLTHLAIEYDNILSCVIDQQGVLSKIKLLGGDDADMQTDNEPMARQDAEFVLLTGTLRQLIGDLDKLLA